MIKSGMPACVFLLLLPLLLSTSSRTNFVVGTGRGAEEEASSCHPDDRAALLAIKSAFGDPPLLSSWTADSSSSCCDGDWQHVECDDEATGRVISLSIILSSSEQDQQDAAGLIRGSIPDAVAGLSHLENLDLRRLPGISGPIPAAIAGLTNLAFLTISRTSVSGPVPSFLGELTALTELDLSYNSLSGSIPATLLANLPNLWSIDIRHNRLTGNLPPLLFNLTTTTTSTSQKEEEDEEEDDDSNSYLYDLRLSHNTLSGGVPPEWSTVRFGIVSLSRNNLTGDASALFGRDKPLQYLDLSRNALSFNLSAVDMPEGLASMDLSHNDIYGGIPAMTTASVNNLQYLNVSYNRLCGQVPAAVASLFNAYSFQNNSCLCGAPLGPC